MKRIIKLFLTSSLSFGIIWTTFMVYYWKKQGYDLTFQRYLIMVVKVGFTFGLFLTISLMIIEHLSAMKFKNKKIKIKTNVERQVVVSLNLDNAFDKAKEILSLINAKIIKEDKENGIIAKTGLSWKSWGEILNIKFRRLNDNQTQIEISSNPKIWTTTIDYGKNFENVEKFCNEITKNN